MNVPTAMETTAERVIKLPLDPSLGSSDHHHHLNHNHSHHHNHNHNGEEDMEMVGDPEVPHSEQQSEQQRTQAEEEKLVSLTIPAPPAYVANSNSSPTINGTDNEGRPTGNLKRRSVAAVTDPSLTAAAAAAVASIQDVWSENFNEPLPTNKEERIQQALEFMRSEKQAHAADKNIKKHSIRQIALFFQVPKSTLYDRLKNKTSMNLDDDTIDKAAFNSPSSAYSISSRSHSQQMKLSLEREEILLTQVHSLCHTLGTTLNLTHIRDFIISLVDGVSLGKKWVHNFTRRHDDAVIYGTSKSRYNVKMLNSKSCRCNFEYLWRCFVPLLQATIKSLPQDKPFYYITRTCIHQPSMSSIFTCFEIIPNGMSIKLFSPPEVIIFPDYFGKIYSQRDANHHRKSASKHNQSQNLNQDDAVVSSNINGNDLDIDDEQDDHDHSKNSNSILDEHTKLNGYEKAQKQFKISKLNDTFSRIYAHCCNEIQGSELNHDQDRGAASNEVPLVIFEGFDDRYNWDPRICKNMVHLGKFLALPWNQQIFQQSIAARLQNIADSVAQQSSITATQMTSTEINLDQVDWDMDMDVFAEELNHILQLQTEVILPVDNQDAEHVSSLNVFASTLHSPSSHDEQAGNDNHLPKSTQQPQPHMESATSANIFENSTLSQLQEVINMIDHNETQLYRDLMDPSSKATLMDIFNKIKGIIPQ